MRRDSLLALAVLTAGLAGASTAFERQPANPAPKKGKPTKADKKAAKRARTRGVPVAHPTQESKA